MSTTKIVLDAEAIQRTQTRIAHEIAETNAGKSLAVIGIHTRGAYLAKRIHSLLQEILSDQVELGDIDISFYRDDLTQRSKPGLLAPTVHATHLGFSLEDKTVVIVDDVLYTGRTVRAAIEALFDYGRPESVRLAVLVDRGHRELPIRPDYIGKNLPTSRAEHVNVTISEIDGNDAVTITEAA